jgi:hypothetical protein
MYTTTYSDGRSAIHACLGEAIEDLRAAYPDLYAIHEVGQSEASEDDTTIEGERDGYRVLAWETEAESTDDSGARSVASVRWSR